VTYFDTDTVILLALRRRRRLTTFVRRIGSGALPWRHGGGEVNVFASPGLSIVILVDQTQYWRVVWYISGNTASKWGCKTRERRGASASGWWLESRGAQRRVGFFRFAPRTQPRPSLPVTPPECSAVAGL